ncbi:MAG: twin-arginine translocase subunit TatC [Desulfobacteraceae bacterium]|nr:twin-arginine translocase subunit TatC [Desulfobacteraceae bacterium]
MIGEEDKIPFTSHLEELRERLVKAFIAIAVGFCIAYAFKEKLFDFLVDPLIKAMGKDKAVLIFTSIPEAFFTYMKVAFIGGLMLAVPVILYQFWMFLAPGLYPKERKFIGPVIFVSTFFFVGGALFGYYFAFPVGFQFLLEYATGNIKAMPSMGEYMGFASTLLLAFGIVFELPLVIIALAKFGIVSVSFLRKYRKYAIVAFFIIAAILTPSPDAVTQCIMAVPLCVLYELSIFGAIFVSKKKEEAITEEPSEENKSDGIPTEADTD